MKRGGEADDYWQRNPGPRYDGFGKGKGYDGGGRRYDGYDSGSRGYDGGGGGKGYDGGGKGYMGYAAAGGGKGYDGGGKGNDGGGLHDFRREFCAGQGKSRVVSTMVGASGREAQRVVRHRQGKKEASQHIGGRSALGLISKEISAPQLINH